MIRIVDRLLANGANEHILRHFITSGKTTSNEISRKDKKKIAKEAQMLRTASASITEVGVTTALVYKNAKSLSEVKNGNKFKANGKTVYIPAINGAKWIFPLALISEDLQNQQKKKN